jgi:hypothetical protein
MLAACLWPGGGAHGQTIAQPGNGDAAGRADKSPAPAAIQVNHQLIIPHLQAAPKLEDFASMAPDAEAAKAMARVGGFVQRDPKDGAPATQKTFAYLGYTERNLYIVFVCFDSDLRAVRSHLTRRESIGDDDQVWVYLDTFDDRRRSYVFSTNPVGVQRDAIYTENNGTDDSFDTLWNSRGRLTSEGYVVWMELPFRSLRFPSRNAQQWGLILRREIQRNNESSFWPYVSSRIQGMLNQEAEAEGIENVSPGRNIQLIPYGTFNAFRALDTRDPNQARFTGAHARPQAGLDAKIVIHDSLVLDLTANPDFSQVESDDPQVTVNQRFEVYFPEKRPFFLENGNYFDTPFPLVFTRRIGDPKAGARLTGKLGRWAIGYFGIDDTAPREGGAGVRSDVAGARVRQHPASEPGDREGVFARVHLYRPRVAVHELRVVAEFRGNEFQPRGRRRLQLEDQQKLAGQWPSDSERYQEPRRHAPVGKCVPEFAELQQPQARVRQLLQRRGRELPDAAGILCPARLSASEQFSVLSISPGRQTPHRPRP